MFGPTEKLKKLIEGIAKQHNYHQARIAIEPVSSGGANYTTNLYIVTISEPLKPNLNLFAKVANLSDETRNNIKFMANVYLIEATFYTELAVDFERIYKKNTVLAEHRLMMPKYYGHDLTKLEEIMVLENLEAKGFKSYDRMKTFNWEYASTAVQQLARFHALGLALRDENPAEFQKILEPFKIDPDEEKEAARLFFELAIKNSFETVGPEYSERLQKYFFNNDVMAQTLQQFATDQTTLIHCDFRPSNLMHRRRNGKLEIIPLDYQTLRVGNPVSDLMLFIFTGSDEEFRRLHYRRLLEYYHTELTLALQHLQIDVEKVYSKKTYEQDLEDMKPVGLLFGLTTVAMVTVAPEDAPKIEGDLTDMTIKPNRLAQERILGIVRDYVRWGVI